MTTFGTLEELLHEARSAYGQRNWRTAYAAFVRADGHGPMTLDDVDAFAAAAWRLGHGREAGRLNERLYGRLARTDPAQAALKAAELGLAWLSRGHAAVAQGWAERGEVLLIRGPENVTHGYLAYVRAALAAEAGAAAALRDAAVTVGQVADRTSDPALVALAAAADGFGMVADQRAADGHVRLDEALLPVLDEHVPLLWAGDVYRRAILTVRRTDPGRVQAWVASMQRWCDTSDASAYRAICEVFGIGGGEFDAGRTIELRRTIADVDAAVSDLLDDLMVRAG